MPCLPEYAQVSDSHQKMLMWRHKACKASLINTLANKDGAKAATNTAQISTNTAQISTNTANIATLTTNINTTGDIEYGGDANDNITLATGINATIDTITLGEGLWLLQASALLKYETNASVTRSNFYITTTGNTYLEFTEGVQITTLSVNIGVTRSVAIKVAASTVISFSVTSTFNAGSVSIDNPAITGGQYLVATKLA